MIIHNSTINKYFFNYIPETFPSRIPNSLRFFTASAYINKLQQLNVIEIYFILSSQLQQILKVLKEETVRLSPFKASYL